MTDSKNFSTKVINQSVGWLWNEDKWTTKRLCALWRCWGGGESVIDNNNDGKDLDDDIGGSDRR